MNSEWIPYARPTLFGREAELVASALESTWISGGTYVDEFERRMAHLSGVPYAVAVSNGTTALHLALLALGIGPGDEVIVPGFTFAAAANMTMAVGAKVVTADIDPHTWCIDPASVERVITSRTRAIIPVHLYGNVSEMDTILRIAAQRHVDIIEDAAEATFSKYKERTAGTMGRIGTLSFHAAKTVTTGEGGMVLTADEDLYERMILLRSHGTPKGKPFYWHEVAGFNFRLTNVQAAIGCAQLDRLDTICSERARVRRLYGKLLQDVTGFQQQHIPETVDAVLWSVAGRITNRNRQPSALEARRDRVIQRMRERGIETRPGFYALGSLPPYNCPDWAVAREVAASVLSLPTYPTLDEAKIERICAALAESLDEDLPAEAMTSR